MSLNIHIKTIPHSEHRYKTVGDWIVGDEGLRSILVSDMGDPDYEFLVAIHEAIEAWICLEEGIEQEEIDKFDKNYEFARSNHVAAKCGCVPTNSSEPGFDEHAPYHEQHKFATKIEKSVARKLSVDWKTYGNAVSAL